MNNTDLLSLVRCSVGNGREMPNINDVDWEELYDFSKQQAITGVMFDLVQRLGGKDAGVPRQLFLKWFNLSNRIQKRNETINQRVVQAVKFFEKNGFRCCLLKGQGNAVMYRNPFARTSGDIDLFVIPQQLSGLAKDEKKRRYETTEFVRHFLPKAPLRYQHVDFPVIKNVPIELHFVCSYMNSPLYNYRLQRWLGERIDMQCENLIELSDGVGCVPVPNIEFNIVFQLSHMMHHFFDEGIGLRQMMDYYYLLKQAAKESGVIDLKDLSSTLRYLNLYKFAGAVMYVMREAFGMENDVMIVPVDERRGKTLMKEILHGGNFGHHSGLTQHSLGTKYFLKLWRNLHFIKEYPAEALCEPVFRTWHFFWRLRHR